MSRKTPRGPRRALGLLHPLLHALVVTAGISLYAHHIALVDGAEVARYALMVLLFVGVAFYGEVIVHRMVMGITGYHWNNIAVSLPISLVVQAVVVAILIKWRNGIFHPVLHNKVYLAVTMVVLLLVASFVAIFVARRMGVNLRTRRMVRAMSALTLIVVVALTASIYFPAAASGEKNIVVISVDSWRYDTRDSEIAEMVTPNVNALEAVGYNYDNFNTHAPYTWTALSSIMTSRESPIHGVRANGVELADDQLTLAEVLSGRGYECFAAADIPLELMGLDQGFEEHSGVRELFLLGLYGFHMTMRLVFPDFMERHCFATNNSMPTTMQGLEFLRGARSKKFFMWLHYYDEPHIPYAAPKPFVDIYNAGKESWITEDPAPVYALKGKPKYLPALEGKTFREQDLDYLIGLYRAEVTAMDTQLGMVLSSLRRNGLFDNTLIVLTADHGEDFGERGQYTHGSNLYRGLLHVPLVIKLPGQTEGERVPGLTRQIDLGPSILSRTGLAVPEEFRGRDILPGAAADTTGTDWSFAESVVYGMEWPYKMYGFSYTSERYKYIALPLEEQEELYDLEADPHETTNIAAENPDVIATIHRDLMAYFDTEDIFGLVPLERAVIGEKQLKLLKTLGYVD